MGHLTYITGPVRSGKSRSAVERAGAWGDGVVFVATYRPDPADGEMRDRVARHRAERPGWRTLEAPDCIATALAGASPPPSGVVIDCTTLWLADRLALPDDEILGAWRRELAFLRHAAWPSVIVGNEVGWSLVPEHAVLRRYRDLAGTLGQLTAAAADEAWLMVAGCAVRLK
jgi:adenosyl cobinamide kinase/adenosyl cobinamide phosphate guanylyltransferase